MLNRKFADLRHAPELDPQVERCDPVALPQAVVRLGPRCRERRKGGVRIGAPGFTWALFFLPGHWYFVTAIFDRQGGFVAHHVDVCTPPAPQEGVPSVVDLKLDLLILPGGAAHWLDQAEYDAEVRAGAIPRSWQEAVAVTVETLERERMQGRFPPPEIAAFRPPTLTLE